MRSYLINSLNDINIYERFVDPATGQTVFWAIVIQEFDPATGSVSLVVESFFDGILGLQIVDAGNNKFTVKIGDKTAPPTDYGSYSQLKEGSASYRFGPSQLPGSTAIIGDGDWVMQFQGTQSNSYDISTGELNLKATQGKTANTYTHELWYGPSS